MRTAEPPERHETKVGVASFTRMAASQPAAHLQVGEDAVLLVPKGSSVHGEVLQAHLEDTTESIGTGGQSKRQETYARQRKLQIRLSEGMF